MEKINVINAQAEGRIDVAGAVGSTEFAMFVYDVPPGERSAPYHYEYEEEWLLVVDDAVVVRTPDGEHTLERGDLARFPAGPDGAHDVTNRSDAPARTLLFSRAGSGVGLSVYPDGDTIGVWGGGGDDLLFRRSSAVPLSERFRD